MDLTLGSQMRKRRGTSKETAGTEEVVTVETTTAPRPDCRTVPGVALSFFSWIPLRLFLLLVLEWLLSPATSSVFNFGSGGPHLLTACVSCFVLSVCCRSCQPPSPLSSTLAPRHHHPPRTCVSCFVSSGRPPSSPSHPPACVSRPAAARRPRQPHQLSAFFFKQLPPLLPAAFSSASILLISDRTQSSLRC